MTELLHNGLDTPRDIYDDDGNVRPRDDDPDLLDIGPGETMPSYGVSIDLYDYYTGLLDILTELEKEDDLKEQVRTKKQTLMRPSNIYRTAEHKTAQSYKAGMVRKVIGFYGAKELIENQVNDVDDIRHDAQTRMRYALMQRFGGKRNQQARQIEIERIKKKLEEIR